MQSWLQYWLISALWFVLIEFEKGYSKKRWQIFNFNKSFPFFIIITYFQTNWMYRLFILLLISPLSVINPPNLILFTSQKEKVFRARKSSSCKRSSDHSAWGLAALVYIYKISPRGSQLFLRWRRCRCHWWWRWWWQIYYVSRKIKFLRSFYGRARPVDA